MKYQWLENKDKTCEELSQELGVKIKSMTAGMIQVGEEDDKDFDGKTIKVPILQKGVEIEIENATSEALIKLDRQFTNLKREGGKSLADEIDALKAEIAGIKAKVELT